MRKIEDFFYGECLRDSGTSCFYADVVHGKKIIKDEFDASDALRDSDLNAETLFWWRCLRDLNNFRRMLKKRVPEVPFDKIEDDLSCLDKVDVYRFMNVIKYVYTSCQLLLLILIATIS